MARMNVNELIELINSINISKKEFTLLSSSALVLRGLLPDAGDLDIAVTEEGLRQLKNNYDIKEKEGNPNWYIVNDKVECVLDSMEGRKEKYIGYYIQDIDDYLAYLKQSKREKDKLRIPLVETYINRKEYVKKYNTLETDRLIIRKATLDDLDDIYNNIWSKDELTDQMLWRVSKTKEDAYERLIRTIDYQKYNFSYFLVYKETNEVIGWAGINEIAAHVFEDYGICIMSKYQGMGLGKELMQKFEELAFEKLGGEKFIYTCFKTNDKSKGLCTSLGFTFLTSEPQIRKRDGMHYILDKYVLNYEKYLELKNNKIK